MLSIGTALVGDFAHSDSTRSNILSAVESQLTGSAFAPAGFPAFDATMASADFPRHFLLEISPGQNTLLPGTTAAFSAGGGSACSRTAATKPASSLHAARSSHRGRPSMRFLFIGPPVSPSLSPPVGDPSGVGIG